MVLPYNNMDYDNILNNITDTGKIGLLNNNPAFDVDVGGDLNASGFYIFNGADSTKKMQLFSASTTVLPVTSAYPWYTSFPYFGMRPGNRTYGTNSGTPGSTYYADLMFAHDNRWNIRTLGNDGIRISSPYGDIGLEAQYNKSINLSAANVRLNGNIIHYSDDRLKINETPITDAVNQIKNLNFYEYDKLDKLNGTNVLFKERGVIAQELQNTPLNFSVLESEEDGSLGVAYQNIFITLCQAVKDLTARIETLESAN